MTAVGEPVDTISRHEPPNLFDRILPADPYGAWLEQREAERDREERPQIRWVYHRRGENGRGIAARRL